MNIITGQKALQKRLRNMSGTAAQKLIGKALFAAGEEIATEAQLSITTGSISGKGHVPSLPGRPPSRDTGLLDSNIETTQTKVDEVEVASNAPYSKPLEFGSSKMAPRPFMTPARDKKRKRVRALVAAAIEKSKRI